MQKMRKMRNWAQLIFVARKIRKFAPTRKPVALETLIKSRGKMCLSKIIIIKIDDPINKRPPSLLS